MYPCKNPTVITETLIVYYCSRIVCWQTTLLTQEIENVRLSSTSNFKIMFTHLAEAAQKWVKLKRTIKKDRSAFVVAFSKTKEEKNKIRIAQVNVILFVFYWNLTNFIYTGFVNSKRVLARGSIGVIPYWWSINCRRKPKYKEKICGVCQSQTGNLGSWITLIPQLSQTWSTLLTCVWDEILIRAPAHSPWRVKLSGVKQI